MHRPAASLSPAAAIRWMLALLTLALAACGKPAVEVDGDDAAWRDARQLVLVTSGGWDADRGELRRYERDADDGAWREVGGPAPVMLGRNGSAWGLGLHPAQADGPSKREGDGRAPAGVFALGTAFGYDDGADTALPYRAMDIDDWCVDVSGSPLYNRIVNARDVGQAGVQGSTEPMRRDLHEGGDVRYRRGFVIEHNPDAASGAGSCIFAHLWRQPGETTAGCTAMDASAMQDLLGWLDPAAEPVFVLLPEAERTRLASAWRLPAD
jgi:L,D-peptidoglycan transpeptidase YkuD (ErfK/YbiS/YcfS/YnhG family)